MANNTENHKALETNESSREICETAVEQNIWKTKKTIRFGKLMNQPDARLRAERLIILPRLAGQTTTGGRICWI